MQHFNDAAWADFARNVAAADTKMAMQTHLEACTKCSVTLQMWQSINAIARMESFLTPPSDVVRVVKSQFAAVATPASHGIRLLFDSRLEPALAGFRGALAVHQLLYETDEYYIDLRVEPGNYADHAAVVGQVVCRTHKESGASGLVVLLREGKQPIAETRTNQFGEFQFEFDTANGLSLWVSGEKANEIVLPLYGIEENPPKNDA